MNSKLTIQQFARRMSQRCGQPEAVCEAYVRLLFKNVEIALTGDDAQCVVKDLGTFKVALDVTGKRNATFEATDDLAQAVNGPFAMFAPEPLNSDVTEPMLDSAAESVSHRPDSGLLTATDDVEPVAQAVTETAPEVEPSVVDSVEAFPEIEEPVNDTPEPKADDNDLTVVESREVDMRQYEEALTDHTPQVDEPTIVAGNECLKPPMADEQSVEIAESVVQHTDTVSEEPSAGQSADSSDNQSDPDHPAPEFSILSFVVGLVVGLALGAVAAFLYMSTAGQPHVLPDDANIVEIESIAE